MLDCMTDGRLAAGFPVGTSMDVNRCYGVTPTETRPRFYEAHDLIMKAWTQPGPFTYNGRFNKLRYVNPWPQPLQKPHPPVWLAGGGSVETWEMAVNYDYTYNFLSFFGYQLRQEGDGRVLGDRRPPRGRPNPYRAGFAQQICVAETDEQAEEQYLEHVSYFFKKCLHIPPYFIETPGYRTRRSTEFTIKTNQPGEIAKVAALEKNWKTLVDTGLRHRRQPGHRGRPADRGLPSSLRVGNLHRPAADRLDAPRADQAEHHPVRRGGHAQASATCGPTTAGSTSGGRRAPRRSTGRRRRRPRSDQRRPTSVHRAARRHVQDPRAVGRRRASRCCTSTAPAGCSGTRSLDGPGRALPGHRPEHPGAGESRASSTCEDLWDLVLYYNELLDALGCRRPRRRRALLRRDGRRRAGGDQPGARRPARADRPDRPVARRPPGARHLRHPAGQLPALVLADPNSPLAASMPHPADPTDPESLFQAAIAMASILQFIWPLPDKGLDSGSTG